MNMIMNAKFIAFLCVFSAWTWRIVSSQQKCDILQTCNRANCLVQPPLSDQGDENKLDRACITHKCNFNPLFPNRGKRCFYPGNCTEGQYCSMDCITRPSNGSENAACKAGFNCERGTLKCIKKPQCKEGEYCKRGDCEGDEIPIVPDDDACEDEHECNATFKCVKTSTSTSTTTTFTTMITSTTTTTSKTDKEEKKGLKWWMWMWFIIGFVIAVLLGFGILGVKTHWVSSRSVP